MRRRSTTRATGYGSTRSAPGFIDTPLNDVHDAETKQAITGAIPLGRWGTADEVAELVVWLASDAAAYATGSYYPIDGAYLAQ